LNRGDIISSLDHILASNKLFNSTVIGDNCEPESLAKLDLPITKREKEVFFLSVSGYSLKDIAKKLKISVKTVENHRQKIGEKLETSKRHEWVEIAREYHVF
jgi:two-component system response regulator NreC